jgi:hypothetical protein
MSAWREPQGLRPHLTIGAPAGLISGQGYHWPLLLPRANTNDQCFHFPI